MGARDDDTLAPMGLQVSRAFDDPLLVDRQPLGERRERSGHIGRKLSPEGRRKGQHVTRSQPQPMIGHAAGESQPALRHVEAVHRVVLLGHLAPLGETPRVVAGGRLETDEIGIDRDHPLRLGEMIDRLDRSAKRRARRRDRRFVRHGFVLGPDRPGEFALEGLQQPRAGRRRRFVGEKRETGPLRAGVGGAQRREQLIHLGPA